MDPVFALGMNYSYSEFSTHHNANLAPADHGYAKGHTDVDSFRRIYGQWP